MAFDKNQKSAKVEIQDLTWVAETEKAYLVRDPGGKEHWLPKSQVSAIDFGAELPGKKGKTEKEIISLTLPEWLAEKNKFI